MFNALLEAPDCFRMAVKFLSPSELQTLRCTSKGLNHAITDTIKNECVQATVSKYNRAVRTPDGAIRIFTRFGTRMFDIHAVVPTVLRTAAFDPAFQTPTLLLDKMDGRPKLPGSMISIRENENDFDQPSHKDKLLKGAEALLDAEWTSITIYEIRCRKPNCTFTIIKARACFDGEVLCASFRFTDLNPTARS